MVHQHFMLIPVMTVAENIVLEIEPTKAGVLLDYGKAVERVREISAQFGLAVDPTAKVESISVGQQQRVEILKALYRGAEILILDEPTAVLTPQEAGELFAIIKSLQEGGTSIIFISHKLNEVLEIADRITVLRRGKKIDTVPREGATEDGLAKLMVGREVLLRVDKKPARRRRRRCSRCATCTSSTSAGCRRCETSRFAVRAGEIVGHRRGRGQRPERADRGDHRPAARRERRGRRRRRGGLARDRAADARRRASATSPRTGSAAGLVLEFSIAENIALHDYN